MRHPRISSRTHRRAKCLCCTTAALRSGESLAILDYLAEAFYDRLWWPTDPHAKAHARTIAAEMHAGFGALRAATPMNLRETYPPRPWDADVTKDIARIQDLWRHARARFGGEGDFLFGDFTIADAMYAPVVTRFKTYAVGFG